MNIHIYMSIEREWIHICRENEYAHSYIWIQIKNEHIYVYIYIWGKLILKFMWNCQSKATTALKKNNTFDELTAFAFKPH